MAKWHPANESPVPALWFVRELKKIDPDLRAIWGMERYFRAAWAIERKMSPERYFSAYSAFLSDNGPRFVEQPIFDTNQPIYDEKTGEVASFVQIGTRTYDLAPEYECVAFRPTLDQALIHLIRKLYWERDHQKETNAAATVEQQLKDESEKERRVDGAIDHIDEALLETRKKVQFGRGQHRSENQ